MKDLETSAALAVLQWLFRPKGQAELEVLLGRNTLEAVPGQAAAVGGHGRPSCPLTTRLRILHEGSALAVEGVRFHIERLGQVLALALRKDWS